MQVSQILQKGCQDLQNIDVSNPQLEAEILLLAAIKQNRSREWLIANPGFSLDNETMKQFNNFLARRLKFEPIAFITNHKEFYGYDFYIDKRVLIPRPESEILVEKSNKIIQKSYLLPTTYYLLELGTGSGCIIISIIKELQKQKIDLSKLAILATDISQDALDVARKNSRTHKVDQIVQFVQSDLFSFIIDPTYYLLPTTYSLIIANLPYVSHYWLDQSDWAKTLYFEPNIALDGGADGLDLYQRFFQEVPKYLAKDGIILIECEDDQIEKILKILKDLKYRFSHQVFKDYNNLQRVIEIRLM